MTIIKLLYSYLLPIEFKLFQKNLKKPHSLTYLLTVNYPKSEETKFTSYSRKISEKSLSLTIFSKEEWISPKLTLSSTLICPKKKKGTSIE